MPGSIMIYTNVATLRISPILQNTFTVINIEAITTQTIYELHENTVSKL